MLNLGRWNSTEPVNNKFHFTYPVYVTIYIFPFSLSLSPAERKVDGGEK